MAEKTTKVSSQESCLDMAARAALRHILASLKKVTPLYRQGRLILAT
jgi:hypothetical protein